MPAMYDRTHEAVVIRAIVLLLAANVIDPGRQSATSNAPKARAGIEKKACEMNAAKFKGELKYMSRELLPGGDMSSTPVKLINAEKTTRIIEISCTR